MTTHQAHQFISTVRVIYPIGATVLGMLTNNGHFVGAVIIINFALKELVKSKKKKKG
jgi:hypothetical protein